jgi:trk system potassium uptake protein TrkH
VRIFPVYAALTLLLWCGASDRWAKPAINRADPCDGHAVDLGHLGALQASAPAAGLPGEMLILGFLVFALTRRALPGLAGRNRRWLRDPELRLPP